MFHVAFIAIIDFFKVVNSEIFRSLLSMERLEKIFRTFLSVERVWELRFYAPVNLYLQEFTKAITYELMVHLRR